MTFIDREDHRNRTGLLGPEPDYQSLKDSLIGRLDDLAIGMAAVCTYHRFRDTQIPTRRILGGLVVGMPFLFLASAAWDSIRLHRTPIDLVPYTNNLAHVGFFSIMLTLLLTKS